MYGFTDKALILFPKLDDYDAKPYSWKQKFQTSLDNLYKYLNMNAIDVHMFYTDDVARKYPNRVDRWLNPLSKADSFFVSKHCVGMGDCMKTPMKEFPELCAEIARKDMVDTNASELDRFNMILRHTTAATKEIMKDYSLIIHFHKKSRLQYTVKSKPEDNRILVNVDCDNLVPICLMSGEEADIIDVFNLGCANRAMYLWEV